jgi:hypothetical protein
MGEEGEEAEAGVWCEPLVAWPMELAAGVLA